MAVVRAGDAEPDRQRLEDGVAFEDPEDPGRETLPPQLAAQVTTDSNAALVSGSANVASGGLRRKHIPIAVAIASLALVGASVAVLRGPNYNRKEFNRASAGTG